MAVGTVAKFIEILYDALVIGKGVADNIQVSSDVNRARRIRRAVREDNLEKIRREIMKGNVFLNPDDIIGIDKDSGGVIVSADQLVLYCQIFKDLRRCRRRLKSK